MKMSAIAQRIDALMNQQGLNRAELARRTNIPYHRLNPWFIRDNAKPNGPDIERVAVALGVTVSYLIYGDEPDPQSAKNWILSTFDRLAPDQQKQLEGFARFLLAQQESEGSAQD